MSAREQYQKTADWLNHEQEELEREEAEAPRDESLEHVMGLCPNCKEELDQYEEGDALLNSDGVEVCPGCGEEL